MAYSHKNSKGVSYFLHGKTRATKTGKTTLYYFAKVAGVGALDKVPDGYVVSETTNGLPVLKKK